jgi:hypothetical protein
MAQNAEYSFNRLTDMILLYGEAKRDNAAAVSLYAESYRQRCHPERRTFISLAHRLRETGRTWRSKTNAGRPRSHRRADVEDVPRTAEDSPVLMPGGCHVVTTFPSDGGEGVSSSAVASVPCTASSSCAIAAEL